jgi:putative Holliday junction resolvase
MGRWVGIDYGSRRIGLAVSDPDELVASPAATLAGSGDPAADARLVVSWAAEHQAAGLVVGLPLNMDGSAGTQAILSKEFARKLQCISGLPVELWDERLSSASADATMKSAGTRRSRRKTLRDALAAQVVLQSFLDARRAGPACSQPSNSP